MSLKAKSAGGFFVTFGFLAMTALAPVVAQAETPIDLACKARLDFEEQVASNRRLTFGWLLSKDMSVLATHKFTGPGPQPNLSLRDPAEAQFFFNPESPEYFRIKRKILSLPERRKQMIQVLPEHEVDVRRAVEEQFKFLTDELPVKNPALFKKDGDRLVNLQTGDSMSLAELQAVPEITEAVYRLSFFVNDDLIFLKLIPGSDDYIVIGGLVAVPTRISIEEGQELLGAPITVINKGVSKDKEKTARFSAMINGSLSWLFKNPQNIIRRNNFFLERIPNLSLAGGRTDSYVPPSRITKSNYKAFTFLRTERQTMRGLPESQVVVFTILPMVYSMGQVMTNPEIKARVIHGLIATNSGKGSDRETVRVLKYIADEDGANP